MTPEESLFCGEIEKKKLPVVSSGNSLFYLFYRFSDGIRHMASGNTPRMAYISAIKKEGYDSLNKFNQHISSATLCGCTEDYDSLFPSDFLSPDELVC